MHTPHSPHEILWTKSATKELKRLPELTRRRILRAVEALAEDPRPLGVRKMVGTSRTYRIRVGDYRVIYSIDSDVVSIEVVRVRHRRDAYR